MAAWVRLVTSSLLQMLCTWVLAVPGLMNSRRAISREHYPDLAEFWVDAAAAYRVGTALAARDPANTEWQRDRSVSHNKIGDVLLAQGDGPGALADYRKGLAIAEALAARDPANTQWQRDLCRQP